MIALFKFLFALSVAGSNPPDTCTPLSDGTYKLVQNFSPSKKGKRYAQVSALRLDGSRYTHYGPAGDTTMGKIEWIYDCTFKLSPDNPPEETSEIARVLLTMGDPCFELEKKTGRKRRFRIIHAGNLHITISEGVLIKRR